MIKAIKLLRQRLLFALRRARHITLTVLHVIVFLTSLTQHANLTQIYKLIVLLLLMVQANTLSASTDSQHYTFAVVPQQSASRLTKIWAPILHQIEKETGIRLILKTAPNIPEFERRLSLLQYDFAYMNPYHFTVFNQDPGYVAIAKAKDKKLKGIIVVRKDSEIRALKDLSNKTVAFPAPAAFAASVLPRITLTNMGIEFTSKYVQTHDSVYINVAQSRYQAGGGIIRTYASIPAHVKKQLRVLWESPGYTPHAIAARPYLAPDISTAVQQALAALDKGKKGKQLLLPLNIKGFVTAENEEWNDVRDLGLDLLKNLQD